MPPNSPIRIQFGLRGWAAIAVGLGLLVAGAFLAIGIFIVFLPLMLLAPVIYWLLPKPAPVRAGNAAGKETIIEGDFQVVDATSEEKRRPENPCPKCGHDMDCIERTTFSGDDMRTNRCEACGHEEIVNFGMATWKALSGDSGAHGP